jgi:hypothetical protein
LNKGLYQNLQIHDHPIGGGDPDSDSEVMAEFGHILPCSPGNMVEIVRVGKIIAIPKGRQTMHQATSLK